MNDFTKKELYIIMECVKGFAWDCEAHIDRVCELKIKIQSMIDNCKETKMTDTFRKQYSNDPALKEYADEIKSLAERLHEHIILMEKSREQSLALTKLEECVMWAVKGIYTK